jgi:hypothetical protein
MAKKYDDFDEADQDGVFDQIFGIISNNRRTFAVVSVTAAVLILGLIIWDSYPSSSEQAATESVPIVRADAGDYKTRPEVPGGMEVPYRDSTVFSSDEQPMSGGTENILADDSAEEPISRDSAFAGLNTEGDQPGGAPTTEGETIADQPMGEVEATQAMNKVEPVLPPSNDELVKEAIGTDTTTAAAATIPEAVLPAPVETAPQVEEVESAAAAPKPAPEKVEPAAGTTAAKVTPGGAYVQLASVKDASRAGSEYKKMQVKYSSLSGVDFRTQEANLGAKGTFYRIQAGPMSKESASKICGSIKSSGGSCLVVTK